MSGYRKLVIDGAEWKWKVGKSNLDIRNPEGKGFRPTRFEVSGFNPGPEDMEAVEIIGPGDVRRWIERQSI
jgi:hypothetical protein